MYHPAELVLKSYKPLFLEKGMYFITKLNPGTRKEYVELWELKELPVNTEKFYAENGYPVELQVVYGDQLLADHHEIAWWDEGEHSEDLYDITLKEINTVLADYDGEVDIEIDDRALHEEDLMHPIVVNGKVVLSYSYVIDDEEDPIVNLEVWTNGKHIGRENILLDDEPYIEHCIMYEDKLWAILTNTLNEVIWPYKEAVLHPDDDSELDEEPDPDGNDWDDMDDDSWKED